jgi:hypothetical protein
MGMLLHRRLQRNQIHRFLLLIEGLRIELAVHLAYRLYQLLFDRCEVVESVQVFFLVPSTKV